MSKAIVDILKNDAALTALLGSNTKIRTGFVAQAIKKPYVIVDIEDTNPTNTFQSPSDLDFTHLTISSVSDRAYTNSEGVGAYEIAAAVRTAIDYVDAGTYNGETIARCTYERDGGMQEDRLANNVQITKDDEYLVSINRALVALPTTLTATLYGYNVIDLAWTDGTAGASDTYEIWRSQDGGGFTLLGSTANADSYRDQITDDSSRYFAYKVRALTGTVYSLFSNEAGVVTTEVRSQLLLDAKGTTGLISDGTDNVAILDTSLGLAENNVYTQDTSSSVDDWQVFNAVLAYGITILGKDDTLRLTQSSATPIYRRITFTVGEVSRIKLSIYVPSGQSEADGFEVQWGNRISVVFNGQGMNGSWVDIDVTAVAESIELRIKLLKGSVSPPNDGNLMYLSETSFDTIDGNHFTQVTSANRGDQDSELLPTQISYDGVAQFNENTLDVSTFSSMSQGSVVTIIGGTDEGYFCIADSGAVNSYVFMYSVLGKVRYLTNQSGTFNAWETDNIIAVDSIFEWNYNSTTLTMKANGVIVPFSQVSGVGALTWFNAVSGSDILGIGALLDSTPNYLTTTFKHLTIRSTPFTDAESLSYARGLIVKHESI